MKAPDGLNEYNTITIEHACGCGVTYYLPMGFEKDFDRIYNPRLQTLVGLNCPDCIDRIIADISAEYQRYLDYGVIIDGVTEQR